MYDILDLYPKTMPTNIIFKLPVVYMIQHKV